MGIIISTSRQLFLFQIDFLEKRCDHSSNYFVFCVLLCNMLIIYQFAFCHKIIEWLSFHFRRRTANQQKYDDWIISRNRLGLFIISTVMRIYYWPVRLHTKFFEYDWIKRLLQWWKSKINYKKKYNRFILKQLELVELSELSVYGCYTQNFTNSLGWRL